MPEIGAQPDEIIQADTTYLVDTALSSPTTGSIGQKVEFIYEHITAAQKAYPTLAAGVTVTAHGTTAWALGSEAEIVAADVITTAFMIHGVAISDVSDVTDVYELVLYYGDDDTEFARIPFDANRFGGTYNLPNNSVLVPANSKVTAKLASEDGDGASCKVKLIYHEHS